ncbi:MAG: major facilitator transporter [Candidatus Rokubacteria bacterium CSP1-6]|nr:MAG: major facilitator transporter [Candidatus Rokubacteria bacterium CSP1-6]
MIAVFVAKTVRTFCYGFLGVILPIYLSELGLRIVGIGVALTLTLAGSAALTWAVRRPAERYGGQTVLLGLGGLSILSAGLFLLTLNPWLVILAAMIGNVAVGGGETGPFLAVEQVVVARGVAPRRLTLALSLYNLVGYVAGALGAALVGFVPAYRPLFVVFLIGSGLQCLAYGRLAAPRPASRNQAPTELPSAPLIYRLAALFALDSFAGGFVLQSLVAYFLHARYGLGLDTLGRVFFVTQLLSAASFLLAERIARRFGLLHTAVFTHLISNVLLVAIAVAPTAGLAIALLWARHLLSQMDVPTRQAYVMSVVDDHEREAASSLTNLARTIAQATTPAVTGWVMQAVALSAPFVLGGGLKIVYDLLLFFMFHGVKPRASRAS